MLKSNSDLQLGNDVTEEVDKYEYLGVILIILTKMAISPLLGEIYIVKQWGQMLVYENIVINTIKCK